MNSFQRIRDVFTGMLGILFALILALVPDSSVQLIAIILGIYLLIYGFRLMIYYFRLARHMVGGKRTLITAVLILDLSLFTLSMETAMSAVVILLYLLGIYAFSGVVDILRALEAKRYGGASWLSKMIFGAVNLAIAGTMLVLGLILGKPEFLVYGFALSLLYTSITRIVFAFRKTAIVYIQ